MKGQHIRWALTAALLIAALLGADAPRCTPVPILDAVEDASCEGDGCDGTLEIGVDVIESYGPDGILP